MKTTLSERGQTAVPAQIRKRFSLQPGQKLEWITDGQIIYVKPTELDPIKAFRRPIKGSNLNAALLRSRREDLDFE